MEYNFLDTIQNTVMVTSRDTTHTSFNEAEHNRAFFERLMRLQPSTGQTAEPRRHHGVRGSGRSGGGTTNPTSSTNKRSSKKITKHRPHQPHHQTIGVDLGGGELAVPLPRTSTTRRRTTTSAGQQYASSSPSSPAIAAGVGGDDKNTTTPVSSSSGRHTRSRHNNNKDTKSHQQSATAAAAMALAAVQQQQQHQHRLRVHQHQQHHEQQQQYILAAMRNDIHRQSSSPAMIYDVSALRQLQQNAMFAGAAPPQHHIAAGASLFLTTTMAAAPTATPGVGSILLAGNTAPITTRLLDGNAGKLSSSLVFGASSNLAAEASFAPPSSSGRNNARLGNTQQRHGKSIISYTTDPSSTVTDDLLPTTNIRKRHTRDEPIAHDNRNKKRAVARSNVGQNDKIFDKALKQLKLGDDGLRAGEYLMSIVQRSGEHYDTTPSPGDTVIDDCLGGKFVKGIVENDNSVLDLLLSQNLKEKIHDDTEKLILDYLKNAAKSPIAHEVKGTHKKHTTDSSKNQTFKLAIKDIKRIATEISKQVEKDMADAVRKGVLLSYVEVKNKSDAMIASQEHKTHMVSQNLDLRTSDRARDTKESKLNSNENGRANPEDKMKAMIIEHEKFVEELLDEHEKRESMLLEENETQKVMHSRMVENCLLASSKALKVVRDKVAEDYC